MKKTSPPNGGHNVTALPFCTLHSALCTLHSALCILLSAFCSLHSALCILHFFMVNQPHFLLRHGGTVFSFMSCLRRMGRL
ncbi:MAG: hypothetical protein FWH27_10430 [Planctomycetaceae bacterium]|nr:hypothetical protein [Planctomycetaceae bacterium]